MVVRNKPVYILYNDFWGYCEFDSFDRKRTAIRQFTTYSECMENSRVIEVDSRDFYVNCDEEGCAKSVILMNDSSQNFEFEIVDIWYEWLNV